jgi:hypothetical protein
MPARRTRCGSVQRALPRRPDPGALVRLPGHPPRRARAALGGTARLAALRRAAGEANGDGGPGYARISVRCSGTAGCPSSVRSGWSWSATTRRSPGGSMADRQSGAGAPSGSASPWHRHPPAVARTEARLPHS